MTHLCRDCGHDDYWHQHRRADAPDQFTSSVCLVCGCQYQVVASYVVKK